MGQQNNTIVLMDEVEAEAEAADVSSFTAPVVKQFK